MGKVVSVKVTPEGVLVPHLLVSAWGDVQEVQIEQRPDALVIKPKADGTHPTRERIVNEMKAAGLVEDLPWTQPPVVAPEERARLAVELAGGKPLSEIILEDREDRA